MRTFFTAKENSGEGIKGEFGVVNSEIIIIKKNPSDFRTTFTELQRVQLRLLLHLTQWITNFVPPYLVSARINFLFCEEKDAFYARRRRFARLDVRCLKRAPTKTEQKKGA